MKSITSATEEQAEALEREIEHQKLRMQQASEKAKVKIQETFSIKSWIREYPVHTVGILALSGFIAAQLIYKEPPSKLENSIQPEL